MAARKTPTAAQQGILDALAVLKDLGFERSDVYDEIAVTLPAHLRPATRMDGWVAIEVYGPNDWTGNVHPAMQASLNKNWKPFTFKHDGKEFTVHAGTDWDWT